MRGLGGQGGEGGEGRLVWLFRVAGVVGVDGEVGVVRANCLMFFFLTHYLTMPQAAAKNIVFPLINVSCFFFLQSSPFCTSWFHL